MYYSLLVSKMKKKVKKKQNNNTNILSLKQYNFSCLTNFCCELYSILNQVMNARKRNFFRDVENYMFSLRQCVVRAQKKIQTKINDSNGGLKSFYQFSRSKSKQLI